MATYEWSDSGIISRGASGRQKWEASVGLSLDLLLLDARDGLTDSSHCYFSMHGMASRMAPTAASRASLSLDVQQISTL